MPYNLYGCGFVSISGSKPYTASMKKLLFRKAAPAVPVQKAQPSLFFCVVMDLLGYATYAIPFLGEVGDLVWAPISAMVFMRTFGGARGVFGGVFNFIEELLPGLDFIPTFTITWFLQQARRNKKATVLHPVVR